MYHRRDTVCTFGESWICSVTRVVNDVWTAPSQAWGYQWNWGTKTKKALYFLSKCVTATSTKIITVEGKDAGGAKGKAAPFPPPPLQGGPTGWRLSTNHMREELQPLCLQSSCSPWNSSSYGLSPAIPGRWWVCHATARKQDCWKGEMRWTPESHSYSAKLEESENGKFNLGPNLMPLRLPIQTLHSLPQRNIWT